MFNHANVFRTELLPGSVARISPLKSPLFDHHACAGAPLELLSRLEHILGGNGIIFKTLRYNLREPDLAINFSSAFGSIFWSEKILVQIWSTSFQTIMHKISVLHAKCWAGARQSLPTTIWRFYTASNFGHGYLRSPLRKDSKASQSLIKPDGIPSLKKVLRGRTNAVMHL